MSWFDEERDEEPSTASVWAARLSGAVTGASMGLAFGPLGMLAGGIGGALLGDEVANPGRPLSEDERRRLHEIYGDDGIDYDALRVRRDSLLSLGSPRTAGNDINIADSYDIDGETVPFFDEDGALTEDGLRSLSHESLHAWQYQHAGPGYILDSLANQAFGGRAASYDYNAAIKNGVDWSQWNAEQQAECIETWHELERLAEDPTTDPAKAESARRNADRLSPYVEKVRHGEGAADFDLSDVTIA